MLPEVDEVTARSVDLWNSVESEVLLEEDHVTARSGYCRNSPNTEVLLEEEVVKSVDFWHSPDSEVSLGEEVTRATHCGHNTESEVSPEAEGARSIRDVISSKEFQEPNRALVVRQFSFGSVYGFSTFNVPEV